MGSLFVVDEAAMTDAAVPLRRAFLGIGTNLGDRGQFLRAAIDGLSATAGIANLRVSPLYETAPVGGPDQDPYLNVVVEITTSLEPYALLRAGQRIESDAGRERTIRWGPRTLDIDVLWIDGVQLDDPELTIPHPRMHERRFVMAPLLDLDPGFICPAYNPDTALGEVVRIGEWDAGH